MEARAMTNTILDVRELSVSIDQRQLLIDVSFSLKAGEVTAIVGTNGAGKSTLLRAIAGDKPFTPTKIVDEKHLSGIYFCEKSISRWSQQELAKHIAVLPQISQLNFPFTLADVVGLGRIPHSTGAQLDGEIVEAVMQATDVVHLKDRFYTQVSGGEQQRCQLARVMAQIWRSEDATPRLLLLDEPTAALDLSHQQQLMCAVQNFSKQGVAVLMVVHDINLASTYADNIIALQQGRILCNGPVAEVLNQPLLDNLFGGDVHLFFHPKTGKPLVLS